MKLNFLFFTIFSFSVLSFANNGCVDPMSDADHTSIKTAVNATAVASKVLEIRTLTANKCIDADQMLELLDLVETKADKLMVFEVLANKLIETNHRSEYHRVKSTFLN